MARTVNLDIDQGSDFEVKFKWTENGIDVNLTGYNAHMEIRNKHDNALVATITSANGKITLATYEITVKIPAVDTYNLDIKPMVYDLVLENGTITKKIVQGEVTLTKLITLYNG